jgi:hypothetical protein
MRAVTFSVKIQFYLLYNDGRNLYIYNRLKHINITYYHIRDLEKYRRINIEYIDTGEIIADSLIKPLNKLTLKSHIRLLSLYRISFSL